MRPAPATEALANGIRFAHGQVGCDALQSRARRPGTAGGGRSMIEVFFRYRVHPQQARAFEHAYGPTGPWAQLFRRHPGYRRTRLFRHNGDAQTYITIDVWDSKEAYDEFRARHADEYNQLDAQLAMLRLEELLLGYYQGPEEYRTPLDALA
jgi:heme-degrading monooxygenase HmoA